MIYGCDLLSNFIFDNVLTIILGQKSLSCDFVQNVFAFFTIIFNLESGRCDFAFKFYL